MNSNERKTEKYKKMSILVFEMNEIMIGTNHGANKYYTET